MSRTQTKGIRLTEGEVARVRRLVSLHPTAASEADLLRTIVLRGLLLEEAGLAVIGEVAPGVSETQIAAGVLAPVLAALQLLARRGWGHKLGWWRRGWRRLRLLAGWRVPCVPCFIERPNVLRFSCRRGAATTVNMPTISRAEGGQSQALIGRRRGLRFVVKEQAKIFCLFFIARTALILSQVMLLSRTARSVRVHALCQQGKTYHHYMPP